MKSVSKLSFLFLFFLAPHALKAMHLNECAEAEEARIEQEILIAQEQLRKFHNIATDESRAKIMSDPHVASLLNRLHAIASQPSPKGKQSPTAGTSGK